MIVLIAVAVAGGAVEVPDLDAEASHQAQARAPHQPRAPYQAQARAPQQSQATATPAAGERLTVGAPISAPPIHSGFLGLSLEFPSVQAYAGTDPTALDPVFLQLIRNISPGQRPVLRVGGDSTDWAWWPVPSVRRPPGIRIDLTPRWLAVTHALAAALNAKMVMGINLEANSAALAAAEARAFVAAIGPSRVQALELGNEPELYHSFGWYKNASGNEVPGRPAGWSFDRYVANYARLARSLPRVTLAGPAIGSPRWLAQVGSFMTSQRDTVKILTVHRYPLQQCGLPAASTMYPSIAHLLAPKASAGLADSTAPAVAAAHAHGDSIRVDEMNSVSCGGAPGVSNAFASALWTVDALFSMARVGVDGVNLHTYRGATYQLFALKRLGGVWTAFVKPQYYGLLLFAQAAPPGSRLLGVTGASGPVRAWATRAPDGRTRVVLINDDRSSTSLRVRLKGKGATASLERLLAPGLGSTTGVSLGGQSFGASTTTGQLAGAPQIATLTAQGGAYKVSLPAGSAALLTLR